MVTGIRVEITGEEIRGALDHRIDDERRRAERWKDEARRPLETQTIDKPVLPTHICMNEERRARWRADRLAVIHERINRSEVYLLDMRELECLGLFPPKPALLGRYDLEDEPPAIHAASLDARLRDNPAHRWRATAKPARNSI